ncbi:hypothetical protein SLE2022_147830 [Rubroshorea leprosula]
MGRRKVIIKRLEDMKARQAKFSKRKTGLIKKAKEISILCDVDLALVMFSPTGKPICVVGQDKDLGSVLQRLSSLSVEKRQERRAYSTKKIYSNSSSEVDPRNFSPDNRRSEVLKLHVGELTELKGKFAEKSKILGDWKNPHMVEDLAQIKVMEHHLIRSLYKLKIQKVELLEEQQKEHRNLQGELLEKQHGEHTNTSI